jgi:hypothetical protein
MLQYNLLSAVRRFDGYKSLGALFRQANTEKLEISIKERIWLIIIDITTERCIFFDLDIDKFIKHLFAENEKLIKLINFKSLAGTT